MRQSVKNRRGTALRLTSLAAALALLAAAASASAERILFIGNSFTYGQGSPVQFYRSQTVTDLNGSGIGGVPALFKSFSVQMGLPFDVYLETEPGVGLDWHLARRKELIAKESWDRVVLQSYSTLDIAHPGDPSQLRDSVREMAAVLRTKNPQVAIELEATWSRADQTYLKGGAWWGKPIEAMAKDVRTGYDAAFAAVPGLHAVAPVGEAWLRAMQAGLAISDPYQAAPPGRVNLWTFDNYHASVYGYYLSALVVFGSVTGRDPRLLGTAECSGYELGLSREQVRALQSVAYEQLAQDGRIQPGRAGEQPNNARPLRCDAPR